MIGQTHLLAYIDNLIEKGFPRFVIITGAKGQGKTEVAKYIFYKLDEYYATPEPDNRGGIYMVETECKVDAIREMIKMSYKQTEPIIYLIRNADKISLAAKNSLLKVIEEPPQNAYFIMTLQQIENTLDTIKSRCQELKMENYSDEEIEEMIEIISPILDEESKGILSKSARNYYQIQTMINYGVKEFYNYVVKVYDNIYRVQSANSFKLAEKLDLKNTGEGYDLELFFNMYEYICFEELLELIAIPVDENDWNEAAVVSDCISITEKYKHKLGINGINKQSLIDMWIIDIRKIWRN